MLVLAGLAPARADVGPPQPPPPPPAGVKQAEVAGISLGQSWIYWRGRRWAVIFIECAARGAPACLQAEAEKLGDCHVVGVGGKPIAPGDLQAVVDYAAAHPGPIPLTVDACRDTPTEILLQR